MPETFDESTREAIDSLAKELSNVTSYAELSKWAADVYASGLLDRDRKIPGSALRPWSFPDSARVIYNNGRDIKIVLVNGEIATWSGCNQRWIKRSG